MSEKTPSERLRESLDELGVEHEDADISAGEEAYGATTYWECGDVAARFSEKAGVGTLLDAWDISPEQAIAVTVGAVTCKGEIDTDYFECKLTTFECKKCGWRGVVDNTYVGYSFDGTDMPKHCPNCGRRIEVSE